VNRPDGNVLRIYLRLFLSFGMKSSPQRGARGGSFSR
jgi:hypothetical protein